MLRPWLFVGFTGHRKLADPDRIGEAIREALRRLRDQTGAPLAAVSSAARGADTLFAEIVTAQAQPWVLLLPLPPEEFRAGFETADWARFERLRPLAVRTHIEPPAADREDAYLECGIRTVDESDVLLAVWDGQPAAGPGGTAEIVAYARSQKKPLVWIHAHTGVLVEEELAALPAFAPAGGAASPRAGREELADTLRHFAHAATRQRPVSINLNLSLVLLHQAVTAFAIAALVWSERAALTQPAAWIKVLILAAALALPWFFRRAHREWREQRLQAEICRSAHALWPLPDPETHFPLLSLPGFQNLQRSILLLRLLSPAPAPDLASARHAYQTSRIHDQLRYYQRCSRSATRWGKVLRRGGWLCTAGAVACGGLAAANLIDARSIFVLPTRFLALALPLVTTTLLATAAALDLGRRSARYTEMAELLERADQQMAHARTWSGFTRTALAVEKALLLEIWEWYAIARFSPNPP